MNCQCGGRWLPGKRAVAIIEIILYRLKARKKVGSHQRSTRGLLTARVGRGQLLSLKSSYIDWRQERRWAVIKGQIGACILPGWWRGQSLSMKSPFVNCWIKHDINKFYHQLLSGSTKETALKLHYFIVRAVALAKDELVWLPMEYLLSLVWHCTYAFFHKINCRRIDLSV